MPAGDRTGPWGMGSMTGRSAGYCAGNTVPGYMNPCISGFCCGRGRGRGREFGRGWRNMFFAIGLPGWMRWRGYSSYSVSEEKEILKEEAELLKQQMMEIQNRLSNLEKSQTIDEK